MISNDDIARFQSDGALCIRRLLSPDQVDVLREGIDLNLGDLSPRAKVASAVNDPGRFVEDFCNWQDNPHYRRIIFETALAEAAGRLMRSGAARLYHDHMLTKEPGTRQPTPWHQDQPYYNIEGRQNISFWIPVSYTHLSRRRLRALRRVQGQALQPRDAGDPLQGKEHPGSARHDHRGCPAVLLGGSDRAAEIADAAPVSYTHLKPRRMPLAWFDRLR